MTTTRHRLSHRLSHRTAAIAACLATACLTPPAAADDTRPGAVEPKAGDHGLAANGDTWPIFRGNSSMTGLAPFELPPPLQLAWIHEAQTGPRTEVTAPPVIAGGRVFVGDTDGVFRAIDLETGELAWSHQAEDKFEGAAVIANEGKTVIAGCGDRFIYAWNTADGELLWKTETDGEVLAGANLWRDPDNGEERVLIGGYDHFLYCLDAADGEVLWRVESNNYINGATAVSEDKAFFGGCDGIMYVIDIRTGELDKEVEIGAYVANSVVIDSGVIYLAHYGNRVEARLMEDGVQMWQYGPREFPFFSSPALTADSVVVGGRDNRLHRAKRTDGEQVWEFRARRSIDSSPVVTADGTVYVGSDDGYLYAVDYQTGEETWSFEIGNDIKSSPAVVNGWLVIGAGDGGVYGFRTGE